MRVEQKLKDLGFDVEATERTGNVLGAVQVGNLLFVSGHGPTRDGKPAFVGRVGAELTREQGYEAARLVAANCLASARQVIGNLDRVTRVVKVLGMVMCVECVEGFTETPQVVHGFSDLLVELYGEAGKHARSAVGMQQLPNNIPVEIEVILEIE